LAAVALSDEQADGRDGARAMSASFWRIESGSKPHGVVSQRGVAASNNGHRGAKPDRAVGEEVSKLVQRVFLMAEAGERPRVVLFAGIERGSGSGALCARAGDTLAAQVTETVCVVDADRICPSLHAHFALPNSRGLADALREAQPRNDFATRVAGRNLWVVPTGVAANGLDGPPGSDRLREFVGDLRARFHYVLINAPPVGLCTDAMILGRVSDGVVLVIEAHATRRETAREAKEAFSAAGVRLLGAVLNNRTFPIPEVLYRRI
jgi:Mrp family chromosome partitioning ATPase